MDETFYRKNFKDSFTEFASQAKKLQDEKWQPAKWDGTQVSQIVESIEKVRTEVF